MKKFIMLLVFGFVINAMAADSAADSTPCDGGQDTTVCGPDSNGDETCGSATCPTNK